MVWRVEHDVLERETRVVTRYGGTYDGAHGARITDATRARSACRRSIPADAYADGRSLYEISWPEATVPSEAALEVRSDASHFHVDGRLDEVDARRATPFALESVERRVDCRLAVDRRA